MFFLVNGRFLNENLPEQGFLKKPDLSIIRKIEVTCGGRFHQQFKSTDGNMFTSEVYCLWLTCAIPCSSKRDSSSKEGCVRSICPDLYARFADIGTKIPYIGKIPSGNKKMNKKFGPIHPAIVNVKPKRIGGTDYRSRNIDALNPSLFGQIEFPDIFSHGVGSPIQIVFNIMTFCPPDCLDPRPGRTCHTDKCQDFHDVLPYVFPDYKRMVLMELTGLKNLLNSCTRLGRDQIGYCNNEQCVKDKCADLYTQFAKFVPSEQFEAAFRSEMTQCKLMCKLSTHSTPENSVDCLKECQLYSLMTGSTYNARFELLQPIYG